jgi:hypothetical protein
MRTQLKTTTALVGKTIAGVVEKYAGEAFLLIFTDQTMALIDRRTSKYDDDVWLTLMNDVDLTGFHPEAVVAAGGTTAEELAQLRKQKEER